MALLNEERSTGRSGWRKSSLSKDGGWIEVAAFGPRIAIRDSKDNGNGSVLVFDLREWQDFIGGVHNGEFDLP